jgi:glycosyltransferase involved in cell wall biosynthesis
MRIGILTSVHPPLDTRIYYKQARSLARHGHRVVLVAPAGGGIGDNDHVAVPPPRSRWRRVLTCMRILRQALRLRCDAYHIHDPELLPVGVLIRWLTRARLVYDVHEDVRLQIRSKYWIPRPLRSLVAGAFGAAERACLRWVDHVILAADSLAPAYRGRQLTIVRNYPILSTGAGPDTPRTYSRRPLLVYCGVVARIRGIMEMLDAVSLLREEFPTVLLHVIGPFFPNDLEALVQARTRALGLEPHLRLHGHMPMDAALHQVSACDIGLTLLHPVPNYIDTVPTKMLEYMSLGLPVIVSHFPVVTQIVEGARCGIAVDPLSPHAVAAAIARLNRDPGMLREYGSNGRTATGRHYSWEAEEGRLLAVYAAWERPRGTGAAPARAAPPAAQPAAAGQAAAVATAARRVRGGLR